MDSPANFSSCSDAVFSGFIKHMDKFRVHTQFYVGQLLEVKSGPFVRGMLGSPTFVISGASGFLSTSEHMIGSAMPVPTNFGSNDWNGADNQSISPTRGVVGPWVKRRWERQSPLDC